MKHNKNPEDFLSSPGLFGAPASMGSMSALHRKYTFPPFSVLNSRDGDWQRRKKAWIRLGIRSEVGRDAKRERDSAHGPTVAVWHREHKVSSRGDEYTTKLKKRTAGYVQGYSIFDPVLCELMYNWFCPAGGQIIDPFAGGSVRGIVAGMLGYRYWGCDLRREQVVANREQRSAICPEAPIVWMCGDSYRRIRKAPIADFFFTCPPYGDLEVYSDDPAELSAMSHPDFIEQYRATIRRSVRRLRPNRFAGIVVGDFRNKKTGELRGFVGETVDAFRDAGLSFYNDMVLTTSIITLVIRINKQFDVGRKIGKSHQNVLLFVKGDPREATKAILEGLK